ncbi:unnamed protein product [Ambrosiozyma monospora]|uniref:Unnamed protein product n=1 Tax=Ambrosiozyma monospora TaxID=43982 RepID=A0ACB5TA05_AMBMO|nr:unnamed protein product [Ambrosiozyma monospora]
MKSLYGSDNLFSARSKGPLSQRIFNFRVGSKFQNKPLNVRISADFDVAISIKSHFSIWDNIEQVSETPNLPSQFIGVEGTFASTNLILSPRNGSKEYLMSKKEDEDHFCYRVVQDNHNHM